MIKGETAKYHSQRILKNNNKQGRTGISRGKQTKFVKAVIISLAFRIPSLESRAERGSEKVQSFSEQETEREKEQRPKCLRILQVEEF
jgi:hypothetical protein